MSFYYWHKNHCLIFVRVRFRSSAMAWIQMLPEALCLIQTLIQSSWQLPPWLNQHDFQQAQSKWHLKYITLVQYILSLPFRLRPRRTVNTPPLAARHVICSSIFPLTHSYSPESCLQWSKPLQRKTKNVWQDPEDLRCILKFDYEQTRLLQWPKKKYI